MAGTGYVPNVRFGWEADVRLGQLSGLIRVRAVATWPSVTIRLVAILSHSDAVEKTWLITALTFFGTRPQVPVFSASSVWGTLLGESLGGTKINLWRVNWLRTE